MLYLICEKQHNVQYSPHLPAARNLPIKHHGDRTFSTDLGHRGDSFASSTDPQPQAAVSPLPPAQEVSPFTAAALTESITRQGRQTNAAVVPVAEAGSSRQDSSTATAATVAAKRLAVKILQQEKARHVNKNRKRKPPKAIRLLEAETSEDKAETHTASQQHQQQVRQSSTKEVAESRSIPGRVPIITDSANTIQFFLVPKSIKHFLLPRLANNNIFVNFSQETLGIELWSSQHMGNRHRPRHHQAHFRHDSPPTSLTPTRLRLKIKFRFYAKSFDKI
jgi:hypothetical protein